MVRFHDPLFPPSKRSNYAKGILDPSTTGIRSTRFDCFDVFVRVFPRSVKAESQ
jgi:hypothetical protein